MKCPLCSKEIPNNTIYYKEYYEIIFNLSKNEETDEQKYFVYKKMLKNMENNNNVKLCSCVKNIDLKANLLLKEKAKEVIIKDDDKTMLLKNNGCFNVIKSKLPLDSIGDFLSEEKYVSFLNNNSLITSEYDNLRLLLNDIIKNNKLEEYKKLKNIDVLNIYNVNVMTEINQKYEDVDNNIINLIKYRIEKNLTTNFIFKAVSSTTKFSTILNDMSNSNIKKFYSKFNESFEISIENSVYKIKPIFYKKDKEKLENQEEQITQKESTVVKTRKKNNSFKEELNSMGLKVENKTVIGI